MEAYLAVMLGGALGSAARYAIGLAIANRVSVRFPWHTIFINITGSFLIGILMTWLTQRVAIHPNWRLFLVVGVLGGYTTFSSFEWEAFVLMRAGARGLGLVNIAGSVLFGYLAVWLGSLIAAKK